MKILITNDDRPEAYGVRLLQDAAARICPDATIVTLTRNRGQGGQGLAITPLAAEGFPIEQIDSDWYVCDGKPADVMWGWVSRRAASRLRRR